MVVRCAGNQVEGAHADEFARVGVGDFPSPQRQAGRNLRKRNHHALTPGFNQRSGEKHKVIGVGYLCIVEGAPKRIRMEDAIGIGEQDRIRRFPAVYLCAPSHMACVLPSQPAGRWWT